MPGCSDCKYFESKLGEFVNGKFESIKKCTLGKTAEMETWWKENGSKKRSVDTLTDMPCQENHDLTKALDRTIAAVDKALATVEERKDRVKLTKKILNQFIGWTTSRYNNYLGFGTKKENVDTVYESLKNGFYTNVYYKRDKSKVVKQDETKIVFEIQCASPVGESGNYHSGTTNKVWRTKQSGDDYTIDCVNKTITAKYSKRIIKFL